MKAAVLATFSAVALLPILPVVPALSAQTIRAEGRVLRPDSTPVRGVRVVLHQVGRNLQGPLDSTSTDRRGRFRFAFRSDTTVLYLLSGRHAGIEYFSPPVHTNPERPDTALRIIVYDTSSSVPIALEARHLVITQPGEDGSRSVLDLLVLRNDGQLTRVAPDSSRPAWSGPLPHGTLGLELGEGDLSPDAISRRNDSLIVTAPLAPGEKQLTVQYLVPSDREVIELPFPDSLSTVNVLVEEKGVRVSGGTMAAADSQMIRGRSFRRWTGTIPAGGALRITVPSTRRTPRWMLAGLVVGVVLALSGAGWYFLSRRGFEVSAGSADELLERLAALDARYLGQEAGTGPAEWSAYQAQRAHLKEQLEASLAAGRRSR